MAVIILNVSQSEGIAYGSGVQVYQLKINNKVLTTFSHRFEEGLSACLRRAADAFDKVEDHKTYLYTKEGHGEG